MKPCSRNKKLIAWLAVEALDASQAAALRDHLAHCDGCRRYWEEISSLTARLSAPSTEPALTVTPAFHRQVTKRLRARSAAVEGWGPSRSVSTSPSLLNWRLVLPAMAALLIALALIPPAWHHSPPAPPPSPLLQAATDPAPTILGYTLAVLGAPEDLPNLLNKQGNKRLPPAPLYTASGIQRVNPAL